VLKRALEPKILRALLHRSGLPASQPSSACADKWTRATFGFFDQRISVIFLDYVCYITESSPARV
jgi:hypothetical protein